MRGPSKLARSVWNEHGPHTVPQPGRLGCCDDARADAFRPRPRGRGAIAPAAVELLAGRAKQVQRWVPGVRAALTYRREWLRSDLVAGVVLAAILVPQGMAYAELAGLPSVTGLYTTIGCLVGYALFGPSRVLVLGPDSSISPLILAALAPLLVGTSDPARAIALAGMLAVLVGLIQIGLGVGRLGFVADLLSSEVQVGYMNGLAITIIVGQLPKLFGFSTDADTFFSELRAFVRDIDQTVVPALLVGVGYSPYSSCSPGSPASSRRCCAGWSGRSLSLPASDSAITGSPRSGRCRRASRCRSCRGRACTTSGRCWSRPRASPLCH